VSLLVFSGLSFPVGIGSSEVSLTGQITVSSGLRLFNISSPGGQTLDVINDWVFTFSVFHSNWSMMNSSGLSQPNITVILWQNWSGGTVDSPDSNQTHYTFAFYPNNSALGKPGCNGWFEVGPDSASDSHLVSCTNVSNISKTTLANQGAMVHYTLTIHLNADARYANSSGSITGAWFAAVIAQDNESNYDTYYNGTALYNQFYGEISVNDSTWAVSLQRGHAANESEVHRLKYTINFESDLEGRGDIFNHSSGYGPNKYILPDNISMCLWHGGSVSLNSDHTVWTNLTWASLSVSWNSTIDFLHRVDLSGMATPAALTTGTYTGNTYIRLRQH